MLRVLVCLVVLAFAWLDYLTYSMDEPIIDCLDGWVDYLSD